MILTRRDRIVRVARAVLEATSPLHIGGGREDDISDADVVRDMNGLPTIPGTSLAGVLRHRYQQLNLDNCGRLYEVFGHQTDTTGQGSRLTVSFGLIIDGQGTPVEGLLPDNRRQDEVLKAVAPRDTPLRKHVRLNHRGVADAAGHGLFDERVVPTGCRFLVELGLVGDGPRLDSSFDAILSLLAGGLALGGHTRRGLGAMRLVHLTTRRFDLFDAMDRSAFAKLPVSLAESQNILNTTSPPSSPSRRLQARLHFKTRTPWAIGSGTPWSKEDPADLAPYREPYIRWDNDCRATVIPARVVIPASAFKGVLAHRVAWHERVLTRKECPDRQAALRGVGQNNQSVAELFGHAPIDGADSAVEARAGIVFLADAVAESVAESQSFVSHHSGIDRFTGGVRSGVLFAERLLPCNVSFSTTLELELDAARPLSENTQNALRRALADLEKGRWQLGSGFGRGHGWVDGRVEWLTKAPWEIGASS